MTLSIRTLLYDVLLLLELGLFFVFFAPLFLRIFNAGNLLGMAVSAICFLLTLFHRPFGQLLSCIWGNLCGKCVLSISCPAPDRWHCIRWILFRQDGTILSESPTNALHCGCFRLQSQGDCSQSDVTATIRGSKGLLTATSGSFLYCFRWKGNGRGHLRSTGDENLPDRCRHCSRPDSHGRPFHRYP